MASTKFYHQHTYERINNKTYKCSKPGCTHKINGGYEYLVGLKAECPYCMVTFIITYEHTRRKKIHCMLCSKDGQMLPTIENVVAKKDTQVEDIFGDILKERGL